MHTRCGDAPVGPAWVRSALVSGISPGVLPVKVMVIRALLPDWIMIGALALTLCLLALLGAAGSANALVEGESFETGQLVVKVNPTSGTAIEEINTDYGLTTLDELPGSTGIYLLKSPAGSDTQDVVERLKNDPRLLFAEPNFVAEAPEGYSRHHAFGVSDINGSCEQYATTMLNLPCAAALSSGQNTTVAIIDTGAQLDHPQLAPNIEGVKHYDFVDNDRNPMERPVGLDADGDGLKDEQVGHGPHVAGIVDLVAPSAKIMALRVLNAEWRGNAFTIAKAISYAQSKGANVINLSLGSSSRSAALQETIEDAIESGVVVAAAAGNSNTTVPHYPAAGDGIAAAADGLVAVTSVDIYDKKSNFANYGLWVDIAAPGEGIRSAFPVGAYANWSGTSMATPFISGQAALIHTVYGSLDPACVEEKMRSSARPLTLDNPGYVGMLGAGRADFCASVGGL